MKGKLVDWIIKMVISKLLSPNLVQQFNSFAQNTFTYLPLFLTVDQADMQ